MRTTLVIVFLAAGLAPSAALADETDNFTCRARLTRDASAAADGWMNGAIQRAIEEANGARNCGADCLRQELVRYVGRNTRQAPPFIPHSALARWIEREPTIERCRLKFRESIYGARPYNQPWLFPFNGRIIFLADSIRLSGTVIGVDKINHFLREGFAHWRAAKQGHRIDAIMARELGVEGQPLRMTERGLRGMALTGVVSYADLAASYSGFRFWHDLLGTEDPRSYVQWHDAEGRFVQVRAFAFADYVTDAWDESINRSTFARGLAAQVAKRTATFPAADDRCALLATLPDASLYVNPACVVADPSPQRAARDGVPVRIGGLPTLMVGGPYMTAPPKSALHLLGPVGLLLLAISCGTPGTPVGPTAATSIAARSAAASPLDPPAWIAAPAVFPEGFKGKNNCTFGFGPNAAEGIWDFHADGGCWERSGPDGWVRQHQNVVHVPAHVACAGGPADVSPIRICRPGGAGQPTPCDDFNSTTGALGCSICVRSVVCH